jgi:hypothetical protein
VTLIFRCKSGDNRASECCKIRLMYLYVYVYNFAQSTVKNGLVFKKKKKEKKKKKTDRTNIVRIKCF